MTIKDKQHMKTYNAEIALRDNINKMLRDFAKEYGLKAKGIYISDNERYKGEDNVPMFMIDILYEPCYME